LFSRALAAGRWALDWATRGGHFETRRTALHGLTLLHLSPYTTSQRPETYAMDHERWLRHARGRAAYLPDVAPASDLAEGGALVPREPSLTMPEPIAALRQAGAYAREALAMADADDRESGARSLATILRWRADLGDDLDGSEIELLRERTPEAGAGAGGPT